MKINVISESAFTVQGHGVHTAFTETIDALKDYTDCDVMANVSTEADVIHIHTVGPYSLGKLLFGKGAKVISAHVTPDSFVGSLVGARYWAPLARVYLRWFYNRGDAVLAVSAEVVDELEKMGVRRPIYLVPNTIRTQVFQSSPDKRREARKRLKIAPDAFVVIGCGQVQPRKRVDLFDRAAKELPKLEFYWVGAMPFKKLAAESSQMAGLMEHHEPNMHFTGMLNRDELPAYFQAADLFFLPSSQETFGLVIVEAAAAGLPILLRDLEQYKHTFGDGYERGSDDTFVDQIRKFSNDHKYYDQWRKAAAEIAARYDAKEGAHRLVEVYKEVIEAKSKRVQQKTERV